jgi:hypothetical protein
MHVYSSLQVATALLTVTRSALDSNAPKRHLQGVVSLWRWARSDGRSNKCARDEVHTACKQSLGMKTAGRPKGGSVRFRYGSNVVETGAIRYYLTRKKATTPSRRICYIRNQIIIKRAASGLKET